MPKKTHFKIPKINVERLSSSLKKTLQIPSKQYIKKESTYKRYTSVERKKASIKPVPLKPTKVKEEAPPLAIQDLLHILEKSSLSKDYFQSYNTQELGEILYEAMLFLRYDFTMLSEDFAGEAVSRKQWLLSETLLEDISNNKVKHGYRILYDLVKEPIDNGITILNKELQVFYHHLVKRYCFFVLSKRILKYWVTDCQCDTMECLYYKNGKCSINKKYCIEHSYFPDSRGMIGFNIILEDREMGDWDDPNKGGYKSTHPEEFQEI